MKISIVGTFPPFRGGISDLNSGLVQNLSNRHSIQALNFTTQYPKLFFPGTSQLKIGTPAVQLQSERILSSVNPFSWRKTARRVIEFNPDLLIFRYWMPFFAPAFTTAVKRIKKNMNVKVLAICDNIVPHEKRLFDEFLTRRFFDYVDCFIVMSKSVEHDLIEMNPNAEYRYAPHPIYDIFSDRISKQEARKKLKLDTKRVILNFGVIRKYKGLDILLNAVPRLKSELEEFTVLIAGECYEELDSYRQLIKTLDISDVIDFRAVFIPDNEVHLYFSAADVVVLPYRSATQSGVVPIAFNFDRPVIVTDVGGLPEIVPDGEVGFTVSCDPESVAEAVLKFYKEDLEETFSENVSTHKRLISWDNFVEKIEEMTSV